MNTNIVFSTPSGDPESETKDYGTQSLSRYKLFNSFKFYMINMLKLNILEF